MTSLSQTAVNLGEAIFGSEVVPSSLEGIAPILRVANDVEAASPRVAYLCRFHAFQKAHALDPTSSYRGVPQFMTALTERLERENVSTLAGRDQNSDAREIKTVYQRYYKNYIQALQNASDRSARAPITKAYQTANVIFEVFKEVTQQHLVKVDDEILEAVDEVKEKTKIYLPFNILPLDRNQAVMKFPEVSFFCPFCVSKYPVDFSKRSICGVFSTFKMQAAATALRILEKYEGKVNEDIDMR